MRRLRIVLSVVAPALSLLAQTSGSSPGRSSPDKKEGHSESVCAVSGRVVTAAEGSPLKSARVALIPQPRKSDAHIYTAMSDGDGRFLIKDVPAGRYQFLVIRAGFVEQHYQPGGAEGEALLSLKPGEKVTNVLFRMTAAAVVSGHITNEDGESMIAVRVVAMRRPTEEEMEEDGPFSSQKAAPVPVATARTDDRGQYRIFGLKPGEYYIQASDSFDPDPYSGGVLVGEEYWVRQDMGSEYGPVYYPGVGRIGQAEVVSVRAGDEAQADFSLQRIKMVEVAGRVIGQEGPATNTWVSLEPSGEDAYGESHGARTDDKGTFSIKGVVPGSYVISAYQSNEAENVVKAHARQKVEVGGENIEGLTIFLGGGVSFEGRVTFVGEGSEKLDHLHVAFDSVAEEGEWAGQGRVKKDGSLELTSVMNGDYALRVGGLESGWYVKSARLGAEDILEKGLQVEKGSAGGKLEIVVSTGGAQLEGSVSEGDQPMVGVRVRITAEPETPYNRIRSARARTDQAGHFLVTGLAPGKYRVVAKAGGVSGSDPLKSEAQTITLSEHEHKTLDLRIEKPQAQP